MGTYSVTITRDKCGHIGGMTFQNLLLKFLNGSLIVEENGLWASSRKLGLRRLGKHCGQLS